MDIVIPYKQDRRSTHTELIYALRSLEKKLKGFGSIFIVGEKISSLKGLNYINVKDDKGSQFKERNIYRKILAACKDERVSENFCFMNNDHFLTCKFNVDSLPFYHKGELIDTMAKNAGDYRKSLNHSRKHLMKLGKPTLDYDTHFPIIYNKTDFLHIFVQSGLNWDQPYGYVIKSLYANIKGVKGEYGGDCKVQHAMSYEEIVNKIGDKKFFSTSDGCMNADMLKYLEEKYKNKSMYER